MNTISSKFYFDRAKYRLGDEAGNEIFMVIDYRRARFSLLTGAEVAAAGLAILKRSASQLARDLISRKHNVNFSDKIKL